MVLFGEAVRRLELYGFKVMALICGLVAFEQGGWSVSEGMKTWWMVFFKGWKRLLTSSMVLDA